MKKLVFITLASCLLLSCGNKSNDGAAGNAAEATKSEQATKVYALDDLLKSAGQLVGETVKVKGHVTHTCKHSGKRCFIVGENENVTMRVEAKGNIGGFNKELVGSELEITGVLKERRLTQEEIAQLEKDTNTRMAEEDGSEESCQAELSNISRMKEWMAANNKNYYSIYYMDGEDYETL